MNPAPPTAVLHGARIIVIGPAGPVWRFDRACPPRLSVWPAAPTPPRLTLDPALEPPLRGDWRRLADAWHFDARQWPEQADAVLVLSAHADRWPVAFGPPPDEHPALRAAATHRTAGDLRAALDLLDRAEPWPDPITRLCALELRARLHRDRGALAEAVDGWITGAALAADSKMPGEAARRWRAAAFLDLVRRRFVDAERRAERARACLAPRAQHPGFLPDAMRTAYLDGLLAEARADLRGAVRHLERAHGLATRLDAPERSAIAGQLGLLELRLGRMATARALLVDGAPPPAGLHERVNHALQQAWFAAHEHLTGDRADALVRARRRIDDARRALPAEGDLRLRAGCALSAAWVALLDRRPADARRAHDEAEALHRRLAEAEPGPDFQTPSRWLLDGRLCLLEGRPEAAEARFAALVEAERGGGLPSPTLWAALHGLGRARRLRGDLDGAQRAWRAALAELDRAVVDVGHRRAPSFLDAVTLLDVPGQLTDDLVDLLAADDLSQAFVEADAAAARRQRTLQITSRAAGLSAADRARWSEHLGALARQMQAHVDHRADWSSPAEIYAARLTRSGRAVRAAFEHAVAALEVDAAVQGLACPPMELRAALAPGEALLLGRRRADGRLEAWWLDARAFERIEAPDLASVVAARAGGVRHLHVIGGGLAEAWSLPDADVDGLPLAARMGMSYLPHARLLTRPRAPVVGSVAVLVDPEGDLPRARADGRWLAERAQVAGLEVSLSTGDAADREALLAAMQGASALHFGGHGAPEPDTPAQSHLRLALDAAVHAEDIVALGRAPGRVVLEGCWTGLGFGAGTMSLPTACLMSGATSVLATVAPIDAEQASGFVRRFYHHGGLWAPGVALRAATAESVAAGESGWRGWRLMGLP